MNRCVLAVFYILLVNAHRSAPGRQEAKGYGSRFVESLPIKCALLHAQADPARYGALLPRLLALITGQYDYLLSVPAMIRALGASPGHKADTLAQRPLQLPRRSGKGPEQRGRERSSRLDLDEASDTSEGETEEVSLEAIEKAGAGSVWQLLGQREWWVTELLPSLLALTPDDSRAMARSYLRCWRRLADVNPEYVIRRSLLALVPLVAGRPEPDPTDLVALLLQVDERVFRDVSLTHVFLDIADVVLRSARQQVAALNGLSPAQLQMYTLTQSAVVLQFLLEACGANAEDVEVVSALCQFLHQQFIADVQVCRLLHFQTYPPAVLPVLVQRVPSLHVCFEFLPEMFAQPQLPRVVFAIQLAAALTQHYPMTRAVECATAAFQRAHQWVTSLILPLTPTTVASTTGPPDEGLAERQAQAQAVEAVLPSLLAMARTYPPLTMPLLDVLMELKALLLSDTLARAVDDAFAGVIDGVLTAGLSAP